MYCGEVFPAELKAGFAEPEGVKWIERPALPPDISKKLELIRVVPTGAPKKSRPLMVIAGAVNTFGAISTRFAPRAVVRRIAGALKF